MIGPTNIRGVIDATFKWIRPAPALRAPPRNPPAAWPPRPRASARRLRSGATRRRTGFRRVDRGPDFPRGRRASRTGAAPTASSPSGSTPKPPGAWRSRPRRWKRGSRGALRAGREPSGPEVCGEAETGKAEQHHRPGRRLGHDVAGQRKRCVEGREWSAAYDILPNAQPVGVERCIAGPALQVGEPRTGTASRAGRSVLAQTATRTRRPRAPPEARRNSDRREGRKAW